MDITKTQHQVSDPILQSRLESSTALPQRRVQDQASINLPNVVRTQVGNSTGTRTLTGQAWDLGNATIQALLGLMKSTTVIVGAPIRRALQPAPDPSPGTGPTPPEPPPVVPPVQAQPAPQSLIPSWAEIFKSTGDSRWNPGSNGGKAFIDLRKELKGDIEKIEILSADGTKVLATGRLESVNNTTGKPRYTFDKNGNDFPAGAIIKATLKPNKNGDPGGIRYIEIPKPGNKFTW